MVCVFRILVTKGLIKIFWQELTPKVFDYTASCDSRGKMLNPALRAEGGGGGKDGGSGFSESSKSRPRDIGMYYQLP